MNAHVHITVPILRPCNIDAGSGLVPKQIIYWPLLYRIPCSIDPWYWHNSDALYLQSAISQNDRTSKHGGAYANLH